MWRHLSGSTSLSASSMPSSRQTFGRKQWREHSRHYLQALLVQSQERRNAENLSETVPASARAMQRFLTEARWDDDAVIGRLQEYLRPQVGPHSGGVGAGRQRFPQTRREIGGSGPAILRSFTAELWERSPIARPGCFWRMWGRRVAPWRTSACICPRNGLRTRTGAPSAGVPADHLEYRTKPVLSLPKGRSWPWRC